MIERLLRLIVGIALRRSCSSGAALWVIRLAGFGSLLAVSNESVDPVRPDIPFAPLDRHRAQGPRQPHQDLPRRHGQGRARLPAQPRPARRPHPRQHPRAQPGGGGPALRPPHRRPDPRRPLSRRPLLLPRRRRSARGSRRSSAASKAASPPRRSRPPRPPAAPSGRARCSTATSASSGTSSRTSAPSPA